jgi:hypothetical protein
MSIAQDWSTPSVGRRPRPAQAWRWVQVRAPGCSTWQIHARVRLLLVFGFGLAAWQMLIRFKPTKSMGPKHLEGHTSIGHDIDKMSEPSLIRTLPARRRHGLGGSGTTKSND